MALLVAGCTSSPTSTNAKSASTNAKLASPAPNAKSASAAPNATPVPATGPVKLTVDASANATTATGELTGSFFGQHSTNQLELDLLGNHNANLEC